jgi:ATP-dependent Clp protease adaptor protein ClpS
MSAVSSTIAPTRPDIEGDTEQVTETATKVYPDLPWITIVWDDPVNLMSYVTHVFMTVFGYPKPKATKLMMDVHQKGKAVVSSGPRERMESDVARLHEFGLWATVAQDSDK